MRYRIVALSLLLMPLAHAADESWRLPLAEKERILERQNLEKHNILGLYPSQVEVSLKDGSVDNSPLGYTNIAHAVCWTANYLAGASYRYACLKRAGAAPEIIAAAKARADELFEAVYRCQLVTGVRGLQARGYAIGHGGSYEERGGDRASDVWYQGAGEYSGLRWRGSPSHHNYSDAIHGLGQYYDLAAEGVQKDRCREAIDALVGYWVDNGYKIQHIDGKHTTGVLGVTNGKTLTTRVLMAIAGIKIALHATGAPKYQAAYDKLTGQYGVRAITSFQTEKDFDDAEHVFCHLENLFRLEQDPALRAGYRAVLEGLWANHKDDAQTLFTYIYLGIVPDAPDREKALREALYSLQTWPTDMTLRPTMSSLRTDLHPPYPVYAAAWDNEYVWKGNLLRPDGWLSRIVTGIAVPEEDPMILYAIDQKGDVYQSCDGAATAAGWRFIGAELPSPARAIAAGPKIRMVFALCDDGLYASTTCGERWRRLTLPADAGTPRAISVAPAGCPVHQLDWKTEKMLYVETDTGVYENRFGPDKDVGKSWSKVKAAAAWPTANPALQFKPGDGGVLKSTDGGAAWTLKNAGLDIPIAHAVFAPPATDWIFAGTPAGLYLSKDAGETWQPGNLVLQFHHNERYDLGGAAYIDAYWRGRYYNFITETE